MRSKTRGNRKVATEPAKRAAKTTARPATGLAAAIKRAPQLSAPKQARARVDDWLGEIARTAPGKALKQLLAATKQEKLGNVIASIAEASPYLWDLIRADPARFVAMLETEPDEHFATVLAHARSAGDAANEADAMRTL